MADLITVQQALTALPNIPTTDQGNVAALVSQASAMAEKYCNRYFLAADYDEIYDASNNDSIILRRFPVNSIKRISSCPTDILNIRNTQSSIGVPRSTAGLATTGTVDTGLTVTGINLSWYVGGIEQTAFVPASGNPTVGQLADAITAIGNGWVGESNVTYQNWPTSDLYAPQGMGSTVSNDTWIKAYVYDMRNFTVDRYTGEIRMQDWPRIGAWFPMSYQWDYPWGSVGWHSVRILYNAGFANVPLDLQNAVILIVKHLYQLSKNYSIYKREKLFDYEYEMDKPDWLPQAALKTLNYYKDWRASGTI